MHRRTLLLSAVMSPFGASAAAAGERTITLGDMDFTWRHRTGRLHGRLSAPGMGWLAVGFNDDRTLRGTRFVIAAVAEEPLRAEIHMRCRLTTGRLRISPDSRQGLGIWSADLTMGVPGCRSAYPIEVPIALPTTFHRAARPISCSLGRMSLNSIITRLGAAMPS